MRRLLCAVGLHRWQYLLAPPTYRKGDDYEPGIWCIFCRRRSRHVPGRVGRG